jgi:uncharacterized protein (TIGR02996 family)
MPTADDLEQAFLADMLAHPADFTPRLVFMDWLDERSDPRGELLRLLHTLTQELDPPGCPEREARLRELLERGVRPVGPFWTNSIGMTFAWIPPGVFRMGSPESEKWRVDSETQREVVITTGYFLGVHTVTQEQWQQVMGEDPSRFQGENLPVVDVSWFACQQFIEKLRGMDRGLYRLPTEVEWEYACRAGTTTPFHFGSELNGTQANCDGNYPYGSREKGPYREEATSVGSFLPNGWGLCDMHGNVREWCQEMFQAIDEFRVLRGGHWENACHQCRSSYSTGMAPWTRDGLTGFRLVRDPSEP